MSTVTRPRHEEQPRSRKPVRPAHGFCRLILGINGTAYNVRPIPIDAFAGLKAFRLKKSDGTVYDVAQTVHGPECDCPDFVFHRDGIDPAGCKHVKALVTCGILAPPPAGRPPAASRPSWTDDERWTVAHYHAEDDDTPGFDPFDPDYVAEIAHEGGDA